MDGSQQTLYVGHHIVMQTSCVTTDGKGEIMALNSIHCHINLLHGRDFRYVFDGLHCSRF